MVYHHLPDINGAIGEFHRVLDAGGWLCVRNSTAGLADTAFHAHYFPSTRKFLREKLPQSAKLISTICRLGFDLEDHSVIDHLFARSFKEYQEKLGHRALSDLASIPDQEFEDGLRKMKDAEASAPKGPIFEPIDLFVFRRR